MRYAYGTGFFWFFVKCGDKVFCAVWSFIKKLKLVVDRLDIREYNSIINTLNISVYGNNKKEQIIGGLII